MLKLAENYQLIDIIGVVTQVDSLVRKKKSEDVMQIYIRCKITDGSSTVEICLWDSFAEEFEETMTWPHQKPIIIILASCKINPWKGHFTLSNSLCTRYFINYEHPSVDEMRSRSETPKFKKNAHAVKKVHSTPVISIKDLLKFDASYLNENLIVQITVISIEDKGTWFAEVCRKCKDDVRLADKQKYCDNCKENIPIPDKHYRVGIIGEDETDATALLLMDREVRKLLNGMTVYQVIAEAKKEGKQYEFPRRLMALEGKKLSCTVKVTEDNISNQSALFMVSDIYEGFELIHDISDDEEDSSFTNASSRVYAPSDKGDTTSDAAAITPGTGNSMTSKMNSKLNPQSSVNLNDLKANRVLNLDVSDRETNIKLKAIKKEKE